MRIDIKGANNTRNFVGIKNLEGKLIISPAFIRSNNLNSIDDKDTEILLNEYGLSKIIDLRTSVEVMQKPDRELEGVDNINIPVFNESAIGITHEKGTDAHATGDAKIPDMKGLYVMVVSDKGCVERLSMIMKNIVVFARELYEERNNENNKAILWHCSEGKDRCGLVSALFLSMLDVSRDDILKDYLETNRIAEKRAQGFYDNIVLKTGNEEKARLVKEAFMANENYFNSAFDYIESNFGSAKEYIIDKLKISKEEIEILKKVCLEQ